MVASQRPLQPLGSAAWATFAPNRHVQPEDRATLERLVEPRWGAAGAYLVALALSQAGWIQPFPAAPILAAATITVITNVALTRLSPRDQALGATMGLLLFDASVLTGALYFTGGASNPLSSLYLVSVALAAAALPARFAWALVVVTVVAFGLLFLSPPADAGHHLMGGSDVDLSHAPAHAHMHPQQDPEGTARTQAHAGQWGVFDLHLRGMWVAFALTAISVAYFVTRVSRSLTAREAQLSQERARAMRAERVASLAGLAASTAHELGTPLASIKLAAGEMRRAIAKGGDQGALLADVELVEGQARRCREILDAMLTETGETVGEAPVGMTGEELVEAAIGALAPQDRERVRAEVVAGLTRLYLPRRTIAQAVQNLLRNALDASSHESEVTLRVGGDGDRVYVEVEDRGVGMSVDQVEQAMEPFESTKTDLGHGLGLFLARTVAIRLGGDLTLRSQPGQGTLARLEVMADCRRAKAS